MKKIKQMLLEDNNTLLNIVMELNNFNGSFSKLNYHNADGDYYILEKNNVRCSLDDIVYLCEKEIDEIIIAMLGNYNNIDIGNGELEDYIEENNLV